MFNWLRKKLVGRIAQDIINGDYSTISQNGDGVITVNGKRFKGHSVIVVDNKIYIDGVLQPEEQSR